MIALANDKFWKDVKKLKNRQVQRAVLEAIENVETAENLHQIRDLKRLKGAVAYRIRIGDYRIGVLIEDDNVEFISVGHRNKFYRTFP